MPLADNMLWWSVLTTCFGSKYMQHIIIYFFMPGAGSLHALQQRIFVLWVTPLTLTSACPGTRGFNSETLWPLERKNIPKLDSRLHHKHCWNPQQSSSFLLALWRKHGTRLGHPQCHSCSGGRTEALSPFSSSSWHQKFHASELRAEEKNVTAPLKITLQCV